MPKTPSKDLSPTSTETPEICVVPQPEIENAFTVNINDEPPVKKLLKKKKITPCG